MSEHASQVQRRTGRLLVVAFLMTVLVVVAGSAGMYVLYQSTTQIATTAHTAPSADSLVVGVGRTPGGAAEWITYAAVFRELQRALGRQIVVRYALSFPEIERLVADSEVDLAMVPIYVYLNLEHDGKAQLIAVPVIRGAPETTAELVVATDSPVASLEDLRGAVVVTTHRSLAGRPFLAWLLRDSDETVDTFFSEIRESAAQELDLASVDDGAADAACISREALAAWPLGSFRVVAESPSLGMPPLVARAGLDPNLKEQIRAALFSPSLREALPEGSGVTGFSPVDEADYAFSRTLAQLDFVTDLEPAAGGD